MYNIKDIFIHIKGEIVKGFSNHLFLLVFIFLIVLVGTSGVWMVSVFFNDDVDFFDTFDKFGVLSYCVPLLSFTVFDALLKAIISMSSKKDNVKYDLYVWGAIFTVIVLIVIGFLISISPVGSISCASFFAVFLSLVYWFLVNAGDDSYQPRDSKVVSRVDNANELMDVKR